MPRKHSLDGRKRKKLLIDHFISEENIGFFEIWKQEPLILYIITDSLDQPPHMYCTQASGLEHKNTADGVTYFVLF